MVMHVCVRAHVSKLENMFCAYERVHVYLYVRPYSCAQSLVRVRVLTCRGVYAHVCAYMRMCICMCVCARVRAFVRATMQGGCTYQNSQD